MEKFWEWMRLKNYGEYKPRLKNKYQIIFKSQTYFSSPDMPKQMLLGYMIEYSYEKYDFMIGADLYNSIEDYYNALVSYIDAN